MPSFGRWQVASVARPCEECGRDILPGETYMRLGYVDSRLWRLITGPEENRLYRREMLHIEANLSGFTVQRLWEAVAERGYPIKKVHRRCWLGLSDAGSFVQRSKGA
jgi:hypothetical protein